MRVKAPTSYEGGCQSQNNSLWFCGSVVRGEVRGAAKKAKQTWVSRFKVRDTAGDIHYTYIPRIGYFNVPITPNGTLSCSGFK